jgi:cobalt-zinc-cadmium efflux system outer membrane protein
VKFACKIRATVPSSLHPNVKASFSLLFKASPLSAIVLAGCVSNPAASLPAIEAQLAPRSDARIAWPVTAGESTTIERAVAELLRSDLTPDSAAQIAVFNNRALRATLEEIGLSQADVVAASKLHNPTLAASVRWPHDRPRGPNVGISLAADLLDNLLIPLRRRIAQDKLEQTGQRLVHAVLNLVAEVKTAVFTVQAQQQFCSRLTAILEVSEAGADLAQRQYDAGNINRLELAHLQLTAQQARLELAHAHTQLRGEREKLNRLLGLSGAQITWKISAELPALPATDLLDESLEEIALGQRLDLAVAQTQITLAERALRLKEKTRLLPASVNLGVETERETDGSRLTGPSLEFALPIFDQGQAELMRLQAELRRARSLYEGMVIDVRSEVREAREAVRAARETVDTFTRTLLPQRKLLLHETLLHYNAMQKSNYELLAAREQQLVAEREAVEAQRDYWIARAQLERVLGGRLSHPVAARATQQTAAD